MPIKIVENHAFDKKGEITVTKENIQKLVNNYYTNVRKVTNAGIGSLNRNTDSRSAWFSRDKVEKLFSLNDTPDKPCDGLRIYFGVHDGKAVPIVMPEYMNQIMVVLVATTDDDQDIPQDQLNPDNVVNIAGVLDPITGNDAPGNGLDNGKLCPPAQNCGGTVISVI